MELWSLYEFIGVITGMVGKAQPGDPNYGNTLLLTAVLAAAVGSAFFVLQGFALYAMAKKRGLRHRGLAFVPFANIILMGRLAGETTFFGQKIKRAGLYAMIVQIFVTAIVISFIASDVYLHKSGCIGYPSEAGDTLEQLLPYFKEGEGTRFDKILFHYYDEVVYLLYMIFGLICEVLMLTLLSGLFKKYSPEGYVWMTVVVLIVPIARCVILFVLRNRRAVDYRAYMHAKYEAQVRRRQQYYGSGGYRPYGGSPYGGYPQGNGQPNTQQSPKEEPFSEFSSEKKDEPFSEFSSGDKGKNDGDSDGFFD